MNFRYIFTTALLISTLPAQAEFLNGTFLLQIMEKKPEMAIGYILGVHDSSNGVHHCSAGKVTPGQVIVEATDGMKKLSPKTLNEYTADTILNVIYKRAWPCPNPNSI